MLIGGSTLLTKIQYGGKPFIVICGSHHISSFGHLVTKFQSYIYVFEVQLFNGVIDDVTGSRVIPEIDMTAAKKP